LRHGWNIPSAAGLFFLWILIVSIFLHAKESISVKFRQFKILADHDLSLGSGVTLFQNHQINAGGKIGRRII
jgi:hypothetical protein